MLNTHRTAQWSDLDERLKFFWKKAKVRVRTGWQQVGTLINLMEKPITVNCDLQSGTSLANSHEDLQKTRKTMKIEAQKRHNSPPTNASLQIKFAWFRRKHNNGAQTVSRTSPTFTAFTEQCSSNKFDGCSPCWWNSVWIANSIKNPID